MAAAFVLLVLLASMFVWPLFGWPAAVRGARYVGLAAGGVDYLHYPTATVPSGAVFSISRAGDKSILLWPRSVSPLGGFGLSIPLWMVVLVPLVPGAVRLLRRALRPKGLCRACGYDLRGTDADSPCPECGDNRAP